MTEQQIEQDLIKKLGELKPVYRADSRDRAEGEALSDLKYIYRPDIRDRAALEKNFREKFEALNRVTLTDGEFMRLLEQMVTRDVFEASRNLREKHNFTRDDGTPLTFTLVNIKDWCKNTFEVVNQLRINTANSYHRYDVILLINGVPVVQIELKDYKFSPRRAMQQIVEYKTDPGNGYTNTLLCFMQLFIVSNRTDTLYFANNNNKHFVFNAEERFLPFYHFADENNKKITLLDEFAEKFLAKCVLGEMISRYMVLIETEQKLLMMRPYQIYAVKAIVDCIHDNSGNGYIWHTTGSGKTLTSFKASTLLKDNPDVEKVLFVVDRKDLDRQTREEFNKFQAGCVEQNTNTAALVKRLLSDDYADKVIVTTIQKLGLALDNSSKESKEKKNNKPNYKEQLQPLRDKRMVFIFDECHRSQFGDNHKAIKEFFPKAQLFGFTGTPIFKENATYTQVEGTQASYKTTADLFQTQLHAYTITNAIEDDTVLRFHVDYFKPEGEHIPKAGEALTKQAVITAILDKHDSVTAGRKFNALLATASINDAIEYHKLFKQMQEKKRVEDETFQPLNIACVFSPPADGDSDVRQLQEDLPQEKADNAVDPDGKKSALKEIMADYNARYGTNHSLAFFDLYYQDVQKRIKDQEFQLPHAERVDLVIVVDMLLTGFDSKYLNTLYVDKNLKQHGLIQAFSRTNRILNDSKPAGNILDFRGQAGAVDEAIQLFSGETIERSKEIWLVDSAPVVIGKLKEAVKKLDLFMQSNGLACVPQDVPNLKGDHARGGFIERFKEVQKYKSQLEQYTDLTAEHAAEVEQVLPPEQLQAFRAAYLETAARLKERQDKEKEDPQLGQLDFGFVLFASVTIDYDYIMKLLAKADAAKPSKQSMTKEQLIALIASDAKFIDEREDFSEYINSLRLGRGRSVEEIHAGYAAFKAQKNARRLAEIAAKFGLEHNALSAFVEEIIERLVFDSQALTDLLAPLNLNWRERAPKEGELMTDLIPLLKKLAGGREISGLSAYEQ
ncbi:MAG: type I restriction endonuclease subunit R [Chloroflexota bacterium]